MSTVEKSMANLTKCVCHLCPTYTFTCKIKAVPGIVKGMVTDIHKAEHVDSMFCVFGKSKCIDEEKGCICNDCDVYKDNKLEGKFFCTK
jgi:hypothetical protein